MIAESTTQTSAAASWGRTSDTAQQAWVLKVTDAMSAKASAEAGRPMRVSAYIEIAELLGISSHSFRRACRRGNWRRQYRDTLRGVAEEYGVPFSDELFF